MAGRNQFYAHAIADGSDVLTPAAWLASNIRRTGFATGIVPSPEFNMAYRQPLVVAAMIGQFIAQQGFDALDNGSLDDLLSSFQQALNAAISEGAPFPAASSLVHRGTNTGSVNALIADIQPNIGTYDLDALYLIGLSGANTGPVTADLEGLGVKAVVRSNGQPLAPGDISRIAALSYDGTNFVLLNLAQQIAPPGTGFGGSQARPGFSPTPNQPYDLTATFTPSFAGVVTCYSRANLSYGTDGASVANQILINNSPTGSGDLINGASTSIVIVSTPAGVPFTLTSRVYSTGAFSGRAMSQYLDYSFIPA